MATSEKAKEYLRNRWKHRPGREQFTHPGQQPDCSFCSGKGLIPVWLAWELDGTIPDHSQPLTGFEPCEEEGELIRWVGCECQIGINLCLASSQGGRVRSFEEIFGCKISDHPIGRALYGQHFTAKYSEPVEFSDWKREQEQAGKEIPDIAGQLRALGMEVPF